MSGVHRPEHRKLGVRTEDLRGNWESSIQAKIVVEPARILYNGREAPAPRAGADGSVEWRGGHGLGTWWVSKQENDRVDWVSLDGKTLVTWTRVEEAVPRRMAAQPAGQQAGQAPELPAAPPAE